MKDKIRTTKEKLELFCRCFSSLHRVHGTYDPKSVWARQISEEFQNQSIHLIGKPGTGKSILELLMILDDIKKGHGLAVLDPHGDLVERLLYLIPSDCVGKVVYFDAGDPEWVPIWNPMQSTHGQDIACITEDLVLSFRSFVTGWSNRMEALLRQAIFGLLHLDRSRLLDVSNILRSDSDESKLLRQAIMENLQNVEARRFWQNDFDNYRADEFSPLKHKLSKLLAGGTVSLMLSQTDNVINFRNIMDDGMIFLADLSKICSEVHEILGSFMLSIIHSTALSRSDIPIEQRKLFHVYLDEAYHFRTEALEKILMEARRYNVGLTLAHQNMKQFESQKAEALRGVGTTIVFNVNGKDADYLVKDLHNLVTTDDIVKLKPREAIVRYDTEIARIRTIDAPPFPDDHCRDEIIALSRQKYCKPAAEVRRIVERQTERFCVPYSSD